MREHQSRSGRSGVDGCATPDVAEDTAIVRANPCSKETLGSNGISAVSDASGTRVGHNVGFGYVRPDFGVVPE